MISRAIAVPAQPAFGIGNSGGARTEESIDVSFSECSGAGENRRDVHLPRKREGRRLQT